MPWQDANSSFKQVEDSLEHLYPRHYDQRPPDVDPTTTRHTPNSARVIATDGAYEGYGQSRSYQEEADQRETYQTYYKRGLNLIQGLP